MGKGVFYNKYLIISAQDCIFFSGWTMIFVFYTVRQHLRAGKGGYAFGDNLCMGNMAASVGVAGWALGGIGVECFVRGILFI